MPRFFSKLTLNKSLQLKQAVVAWTITALVINPAIAQQQSAAMIKQQQARAIAERISVDRQASQELAIQLENAANSDTALKEAMNGTTVVDIATPSAKGVSKNNWNEFNVNEQGIIFNNSAAPVLTQLGGWADGNRRLAGGEASIILNQVNGADRSRLLGQIEIAGKSAEFILANPNGITCNGCGFINTPAVSLITGQSRFDQNGDLIFDITQGDFLLEGKGINATNLDRFDIVSRYAKINAALYADQVNIITGANQFNYQSKQLTGQSAGSPNLQFALDSTALGGMYANRIHLIGTEKGLGVNLDGLVQSTDQLTISADGNIQVKQLQANNQIGVRSTSGDINNQSLIYSKQVELDAANQIQNEGFMGASDTLSLTAKQLNQSGSLYAGLNSDNTLNATGSLTINAAEQVSNTGNLYVGGALNLQTPQITNHGTWVLQTQQSLNTGNINNAGSIRFNNQDAAITANSIDNTGDIQHLGTGVFDITLDQNLTNNNGLLAGNGNLFINATDLLNSEGQIFANYANLNIEVLDNTSGVIELESTDLIANQLNNSFGRIILQDETANSSLNLENGFNNQSGVFYADSNEFQLIATQLNNQQGNLIVNNSGLAKIDIHEKLNNQSGFLQTNNLLLTAASLNNTDGSWLTDVNNSSVDHLINDNGFIQGKKITLTGTLFDNQGGALVNIGSNNTETLSLNFTNSLSNSNKAVIRNLKGDIQITTGELLNNTGVIDAKGILDLKLAQLLNQQGSLQTTDSLNLTANGVDNQGGVMQSNSLLATVDGDWNNTQGLIKTGEIDLQANTLNNSQAYLLSEGKINILLDGNLVNRQGVIANSSNSTADTFDISARNLENSGEIIANATFATIQLNEELNNTGIIENSQSLNITASAINNNSGSLTAGDITLSASTVKNNSSTIDSTLERGQITADQITINTNEFTNALYSLIYADQLTLKQNQQYTPTIINQGDLVADQIEMGGDSLSNSGRILSATDGIDSLVFTFINQINNSGQISRNNDWSMTAAQFTNTGRLESSGSGTITAQSIINNDKTKQFAESLSVSINLNKGLIGANSLVFNSNNIDNQFGILIADEEIDIKNPANIQLNNQAGFIQAGSSNWVLNNIQLNNAKGTIWHSGNGNAELNLLGNLNNDRGSIVSEGNLDLELQHSNSQLTNDQGLIQANQLVITTGDAINNVNAGALVGNQITLNTARVNNQGGIIEATAIDTAQLNINASLINNTDDGEIRSSAKDWTLSLSQLNNDGGKIVHLGTGQLNVISMGELINRGDIHSDNHLVLNVNSLNNQGRLSSNNQLSLTTQNGIFNTGTGEISTLSQFFIDAQNQTITNQGYWFTGKQFDPVSSLEGSEWINEGEWILGDATTDSINLSLNRLSNSGWISYNNTGSFTANATEVDNTGILISSNGNLTFTTDNLHNSGELHAENVNVDAMQLNNLGRITSSGQITLNTQLLVNQDQQRQLANNFVVNPAVDQGVILADQLHITADTVQNNFGALISQSNADNSLLIQSRSATPLVFNNNQGIVQSAANNWTLTNLQLTNIDGRWLHIGDGLADWSMVNSLNNTRGSLRSEGELILKSTGVNNSLINAAGVITADLLTIDSDDRINNTRANGMAGTISAGSVILTASTINNDGGIIEANYPETAQLQLNGQVNNINQGELRSAATDWSLTLDSINNQGGRILHTGSGSLNLDSTGEFINEGILYSAGQLNLSLDSLINSQQIFADIISIATQNGIHNQASASIYASTETQLNAQNQSITNDGEWYLGESFHSDSRLTGSQWNNNGQWIIGDLQDPSANAVTFSLDEFNNNGIVSYNNTGILTINANKINNLAQSTISANNGSANFNLTGVSDSSSGFSNTGDIVSNNINLAGDSSTQSWINRGRLQASQFSFTNVDLLNDTNGIVFGTANNSVFTFDNNSQLTNNGKWYSNATNWTLNSVLGSGEFFHLGTGNLTLNFNNANTLAATSYFHTAGAATIGGTIQGSIAANNNPNGDLRTTIVAQGNIVLDNNLVNQNAAIHSYGDVEIRGNLDNSGRISTTQQLFTSNNAQADITNSGQIKANSFALTVNQLVNSGDLLALGELAGSISSVVSTDINNQGGLIQVNNENATITTTNLLNNFTGVIAKNNAGTLTFTTNQLNNTDGLIAAETGNLSVTTTGDLINQQTPLLIGNARGIYANQLTLTSDLLNNTNGIISISSADKIQANNTITVNGLMNTNGALQLSHFNEDQTKLDSLVLAVANNLDNTNGNIRLLNLITNPALDQNNPDPLINVAGSAQLAISTAALNNQTGSIVSDGLLIIDSQNANGTKTLLTNSGQLQALRDLTINAAGLNNSGQITGSLNGSINLNLDGFNLTNVGANADIYSFDQLIINANQVINSQKMFALKKMDVITNSFGQVGNIGSAGIVNLDLQTDLVLSQSDSIIAPGALSITTPGDINNAGTISATNHLVLSADNLLNDTTGNILAGVGSEASEFRINRQLLNRGLISTQGDLNIITPEFINEHSGRIVTGLYLDQNQDLLAGDLEFNLTNSATGIFTNEGTIYSRGSLDILNVNSVVNQNDASLIAQQSMLINANNLINDQSRIETLTGDLTLNISTSLINRSLFDPNAVSKSYLSYQINRSGFANEVPYYTDVINNGGGYYDEIYTTRYSGTSSLGIIQSGNTMNILGTATISNEYGSIYSTGDLLINGANLNVNSQNLGQITERLYLNNTAGPRVCGPFQSEPSCYNIPAFYYSGLSEVVDEIVNSTYGYIHSGGSISGNLSQGLVNGSGNGSFNCDPNQSGSDCALTAPQNAANFSGEFEKALDNFLPDEFRKTFGLTEKIRSADEENSQSQNTNPDDEPEFADATEGADAVNANTNNPDPIRNKTLNDINNEQAANGSDTGGQNANFVGETGEQGEARETGLLANADETSDQLTQGIPETIAKANAQPLKNNQWPLISFTVLPFNFDLKNLSGLYVVSQNPDSKYLIETRPEFTLYENFLGSDYLLDALGYNADQTIKRLGDAFFENMLIRDALIKETNSRYIDDATSDYDTMQRLMDNAVATASKLELVIGVELTPEQSAALTQDMMWLVKKKINGQEVLVPHLYLTSVSPEKIAASKAAIGANGNIALKANSIDNQNSIYAGNNLSLTADLLKNNNSLGAGGSLLLATRGDLQQDGRLFAQGDVRLLAAGSMANNGSINANNVVAVAQGMLSNSASGSINATENLFLQSTQDSVVNRQGAINANNITMDANNNVELTGSLSAKNNLSLLAGQDVLLKATKAEESYSSKKIQSNSVQYTATNLVAGGNITLDAGRDIQAEGSDFTAGSGVNLHAERDINLQAMKNEDNYEYKAKRKKEIHNTVEHDVVNINSGATVSIDAGRDNNLTGTNIAANDDVFISADRDTNISAVVDSDYDYSYSKKKKSFGRSKTKIDETLVENVVGGTIAAGGNVLINAVTDAEGNIGLTNSRNVNLNGAVIASNDGDVVIAAKEDVTLGTVEVNSIDYHLRKKSGTGGLTGKSKSSTHNSTEQIGSQIQSGNDAVVLAGSDATLVSAAIATKGNIQIDAGLVDDEGDVNLLTADNSYLDEEKKSKKSMSLKINKDGMTFDKTTKSATDNTDIYRIGNLLTAGCNDEGVCSGDVNLSTTRDINIIGSSISGNNITADAGRDVNLLAAQDDVKSGKERSVSRNGISMSDNSNGVSLFAGEETNKDRLETRDKVSISTSLNSTENTIINADRDINLAGSEINSEKSIKLDAKRNVTIETSEEHYQQSNEHKNIKDGLTVTANHNLGNTAKAFESLGDMGSGNAVNDASTAMRAMDAISNAGPSASAHLGRTTVGHKQTDTDVVAQGSTLNAKEDIHVIAGETATVLGSELNAKRKIGIDANDINILASENATDSKSKDSYHKTGVDVNAGGGNVSITGGFTMSSSELKTKDITANASKLNAEDISLTAKNDINVKGSDLLATRDITLDAEHDVNITSADEYTRSEFDSEYKSLNAGVNIGASGVGVTVNGSIGEEELDRTNLTHRNSQISAGEELSITSGNDTTIKGANVTGKDVDVNVGNNLTIASEQNTGDVKGHKYDASFSLTVGAGVSGSLSLGYGETEGSSAWTANQTSLTGSNSINVNVKNHTQLDGAVLGNITTDENGNTKDGNNFNLTTKTFGFTDLKDHDKEKSTYVGISIGFDNGGGGKDAKGSSSFGLDAQYSSHNKQQDTLATLGNGNITIQSDIDNGTNSLEGINRDVTESQIITKDKSRNYDVYVNSNTIETLTNKDKRDQLVARVKDPSRIVGESLAFGEIVNSLDDAAATIKNGEIKAPTKDQLAKMSPDEQQAAWAKYNYDKENQGVINTSSAEKFDNSIKDFAVATRQTVIGINHDGGLNLFGTGEGNNLVENYQRNQDGRYNTLDGRANLSNQIQFTGQDGKNKDGVDILNNATLYSVDGNQLAMQTLVDGMTGRTDIDALLYSQAPAAGLPSDAKAVAINNDENNTHIVGVNIDKTNLKNQSDFITSIAEETRHTTNPEDHNANQYAAQSAYVWREENIKEGRQTGQGVSNEQWREDNRNDATIKSNNERIGSQRVSDMEFRGLDERIELPLIRDTSHAFAKHVKETENRDITPEQAEQELVDQALKRVDSEFAHLPENEAADEWLNAMDNGIIKDENGEYTVRMFASNDEQYNSDHETAQQQYSEINDPNHLLTFNQYNSDFVLGGANLPVSAEALSRTMLGGIAYEGNQYGQNDVVFADDGLFGTDVFEPAGFWNSNSLVSTLNSLSRDGIVDNSDLIVLKGKSPQTSMDLQAYADFIGLESGDIEDSMMGIFEGDKYDVLMASIAYHTNYSSSPSILVTDNRVVYNDRFDEVQDYVGGHLNADMQSSMTSALGSVEQGQVLNLSPYRIAATQKNTDFNGNWLTDFSTATTNYYNDSPVLQTMPIMGVLFGVPSLAESTGRNFETTFTDFDGAPQDIYWSSAGYTSLDLLTLGTGVVAKPVVHGARSERTLVLADDLLELPQLPDGYHYKNINGENIVSRNPGQAENLPQLKLENGKLIEVEDPPVSYHRQSEIDVGSTLPEGTRSQQAFKDGVPVPINTPGSVRPDFCDANRCDWSLEVKNYDLSRPGGQQDLVDNVSGQVIQRQNHLPSGMEQQVVIDVRGKNVSLQQQNEIRKGIVDKSGGAIKINSIRFFLGEE